MYAPQNEYPLAYVRSAGEESLLVILNPAEREIVFECGCRLKETVYSFGKEAENCGEGIRVSPCSAGIYRI